MLLMVPLATKRTSGLFTLLCFFSSFSVGFKSGHVLATSFWNMKYSVTKGRKKFNSDPNWHVFESDTIPVKSTQLLLSSPVNIAQILVTFPGQIQRPAFFEPFLNTRSKLCWKGFIR